MAPKKGPRRPSVVAAVGVALGAVLVTTLASGWDGPGLDASDAVTASSGRRAPTGDRAPARTPVPDASEPDSPDRGSVSATGAEYRVTSDSIVRSIVYVDAHRERVRGGYVGLSWDGDAPRHGRARIVATAGPSASWIRCTLTVEGRVVAQQRASGGSGTVTCAARL